MKIIITEQQLNVIRESINNNFLYHGSNIKNLKEIQNYGLLPTIGDTVKSTEAYKFRNGYEDDEGNNNENELEGIIFFSDNPSVWQYSHDWNNSPLESKPDINNAVLVLVEKNNTIFQRLNDDFFDINGNQVTSINRISVEHLPNYIEHGDFFSLVEQEPLDILYGERLIEYLKVNEDKINHLKPIFYL